MEDQHNFLFNPMARPWEPSNNILSIIPSWRKQSEIRESMNEYEYDEDGYDRDGYDVNGYDPDGYNPDGYHRDGYDVNGFNENGVHVSDEEPVIHDKYEIGNENFFDTPNDFYRKNEPDSLDRSIKEGQEMLWNPVRGRWIQDNVRNRTNIRTQKRRNPNRIPRSPPKELMRIVARPKMETPVGSDDLLNLDYCRNKFNKNIITNLDNISVSSERVDNAGSNIKCLFSKIDVNDVPCILEYNDGYDNLKLNIVEYINKGSFGVVLKYSNETPLPDGWTEQISNSYGGIYYVNASLGESVVKRPRRPEDKFIEVAVKTYRNQQDSEINLIETLNLENDSGFCNTLNAKILKVVKESLFGNLRSTKSIAIMDYMDGTLYDLVENANLTVQQAIDIMKEVVKSFNCIYPKYSYTDLKSQNVLYKCYKARDGSGKVKIVLGDLGSLCVAGEGGPATYPPPEAIHDPGETPCDEKVMVWDIAVLMLELLDCNVHDLFYHSGDLIEKAINNFYDDRYISYIIDTIQTDINEFIDYKNYENVYVNRNTTTLLTFFNMIFAPANTRINLNSLNIMLNS